MGIEVAGPAAGLVGKAALHHVAGLAPGGALELVIRLQVPGVGVSTAEAWRTPLGDMAVDVTACRELVERREAVDADDAHGPEHSLEVHLPFIHEAGQKGVKILGLQEIFNGPYFCPGQSPRWYEAAEPVSAATPSP